MTHKTIIIHIHFTWRTYYILFAFMIIVCDDVKLTKYCNNKHAYDVLVISILNFKEVIKTTLII